MSWSEKLANGPFCCIVNKDDYDKRMGYWLEYFLFTEKEYYDKKEMVILMGLWEEFCQPHNHHKIL
jgi:hypothetical protein